MFKNLSKIYSVFLIVFLCLVPVFSKANPNEEEISQKEEEINEIQKEIKQYRKSMDQKDIEISSLEAEIEILGYDINDAQNDIIETQNKIISLEGEISQKELELELTEIEIKKNKDLISYYLQVIYEKDQKSPIEILMSQDQISQFFNEVNSVFLVEEKLKDSLKELGKTKEKINYDKTQIESTRLEKKQHSDLKELQKAQLANQKIKKEKTILEKESESQIYEKLIADSEKAREELEQNIYRLQIGNVSKDFTLDDAFQIAKNIGNITNVRPAFLLAILKQESNFGKNTGTANYLDALTCNGQHTQDNNWISQNIKDFETITGELGLDPSSTLVSACPGYGTGGAMGPAQFMPSTWMGYKDEVAKITGNNPPNPWDLSDAMAAMGLKLAKGGASEKTYQAEFNAALLYFAGNVNHKYDWYAESVLELAKEYEAKLQN